VKRILMPISKPISNSKKVEKTPHIKKYREDLLQDTLFGEDEDFLQDTFFDIDENTEKEIEETLTQKKLNKTMN
jgi:hypothetical protein